MGMMVRRNTAKALGLPPVSGVSSVWFADDLDQADSTDVTSWSDTTGTIQAEQAVSNNCPTFIKADPAFNGRASVQFGADRWLEVAAPLFDQPTGKLLMLLVLDSYEGILFQQTNTSLEYSIQSDNAGSIIIDNTTDNIQTVETLPLGEPILVEVYKVSDPMPRYSIRFNLVRQNLTGVNSGTWFGQVGSFTDSMIGPFDGRIAFIGLYNGAFGTEDYTYPTWINKYYALDFPENPLVELARDKPLAFWPLYDYFEFASEAWDTSGNGRNLTRVGSVGQFAEGIGPITEFSCANFTSSHYLTRASEAWMNVPNITVEALFRLDAMPSSSNTSIIQRFEGTSQYWALDITAPGFLRARWLNSSNMSDSLTYGPLTTNKTYHVMFVYGAAEAALYLDGDLVQSTSVSLPLRTGGSSSAIFVGRMNTSYFRGKISMVALYNKALSSSRIYAHMKDVGAFAL